MATRLEDMTTLLENTTMQKVFINEVHKQYYITPNDGYVLHDNRYDTYAEYDENGNGVGDVILGYRTSTASCAVRKLVVDDNGNIVTNDYDFYAVPTENISKENV